VWYLICHILQRALAAIYDSEFQTPLHVTVLLCSVVRSRPSIDSGAGCINKAVRFQAMGDAPFSSEQRQGFPKASTRVHMHWTRSKCITHLLTNAG